LIKLKKTAAGNLPWLITAAKMQLLMEVTLLEQYLADPKNSNQHGAKYKKSQKFYKQQPRFNPISLWYLVQHAWGYADSYLCMLRKCQKEFARATSLTDEAVTLLFVALPPMDPVGATLKSVINDYEFAKTVYTSAFLYAVKEYHDKAKDNLDCVDRSHTPSALWIPRGALKVYMTI
jgi:hypothetical protein